MTTTPVTFGSTGLTPFAQQLRSDLIEIIRWADANSKRSQQAQIGPSELGNDCDRFIAYRLSGVPETNTYTDPWPAIVGTAIHQWLEQAVQQFQRAAGGIRFSTEVTVHPDALIRGHLDLFDHWLYTVIDWKSLGPTKVKLWHKSGPPINNWRQVNLYGKGAIEAGQRVEKVALIGVPRSGWLEDMIVEVDDYRPELAQEALDRMYRIAELVDSLRLLENPDRFDAIEATPEMCTFCPFFRPLNRESGGADATGCPGR